jgi:hypothetical protein
VVAGWTTELGVDLLGARARARAGRGQCDAESAEKLADVLVAIEASWVEQLPGSSSLLGRDVMQGSQPRGVGQEGARKELTRACLVVEMLHGRRPLLYRVYRIPKMPNMEFCPDPLPIRGPWIWYQTGRIR